MIIEKLIKRIKGDPNYKWDSTYSFRDLTVITTGRLIQVVRGMFYKPFFKSAKGLLFIGSNVKVKHGYQIATGNNLILGDDVNIDALSTNGITIGDDVSIGRNSIIFCTGVINQKGTGITIGNRTGINAHAYFAGQGGITVGDDVIMGPNVQIFSETHNFSNLKVNIKDQGVTRRSVSIGNNCWLGAGSKILAGVTVGNGCVVAAGSIVTKSIPDNSIVAGVPAKVIKSRDVAQPINQFNHI